MPASTRSSTAPDPSSDHLWITILAGGMGSRFWPLSTPTRPKQLLPLGSDKPMIVETVARARSLVPVDRLRIVAGEQLAETFREVIEGLPESVFLVEPRARGTAAALAWAAWNVSRRDPDAVLVSLHSDHIVHPLEAFRSVVTSAAAIARSEGVLVTVGARPDRPETGYGYIQPGPPLGDQNGSGARRVDAFREKPDVETAERYVGEGYLWNTGIFVWTARDFLDAVESRAPEVAPHLARLEADDVEGFFDAVTPVSVDVAVMERSDRVAVVPATFEWDDVGTWEALHRTRAPGAADDRENVVLGDGVVVDGSGNLVFADEGAVVLFGVDDLVAVRTGGVTLVTPRARSADLKRLLDHIPDHLRSAP